jgi:hypothetical protein
MQYLLLIYDKESDWGKLSEAQQGSMMQEYQEFTKSIHQSGHYRAGSQLHPVSKATTVRVRDGKKLITDGPFAETKEQLGGYYLVEAKDLDDAVAWLRGFLPSGWARSRCGRWSGATILRLDLGHGIGMACEKRDPSRAAGPDG